MDTLVKILLLATLMCLVLFVGHYVFSKANDVGSDDDL